MAYVIADNCVKDELCADVCPTDCIHPKKDEPEFEVATQLLCRSRRLYRLRSPYSGLHVGFDLCCGGASERQESVSGKERRLFREAGLRFGALRTRLACRKSAFIIFFLASLHIIDRGSGVHTTQRQPCWERIGNVMTPRKIRIAQTPMTRIMRVGAQ